MSAVGVPFGQTEDDHHVWRGRAALFDRPGLARDAAALLNSGGGEIWIGLGQDSGRVTRVEPITRPEQERDGLRWALIDRIEPHLTSQDLAVEVVAAAEGGVLRVVLTAREEQQPYAALGTGFVRHYLRRLGHRRVGLSRAEILVPTARSAAADPGTVLSELETARRSLSSPCCWLALRPWPALAVDLASPRLVRWLTEPRETTTDWDLPSVAVAKRPEREPGRLIAAVGPRDRPFKRLAALASGGLEFLAALDTLTEPTAGSGELSAARAFGLLASFCRLAQVVDGAWGEQTAGEVFVDFLLLGVAGRPLRSGRTYGEYAAPRVDQLPRLAEDFELTRPFQFSRDEIRSVPGQCAARMLEHLLEAAGLGHEVMPDLLDPVSQRLDPQRWFR